MRKLLLVLVVLGFISFSYGEKIRLTNGEWPPFNGEKIYHQGFGSDVVREAFKLSGVEVEYGFFPWKRAFEIAKKGEWDGSAEWTYKKDRESYFYYAKEPIMSDDTVFFVRRGNEFSWSTLSDLKGKKIGGTRGYSYVKDFKKAGIPVDIANSDLTNFKKLIGGRIDVFLCSKVVGFNILAKYFSSDKRAKVTYIKKAYSSDKYYLILNKINSKNKIFLKKFNEGFKKLKASGKYEKMYQDMLNGKYK